MTKLCDEELIETFYSALEYGLDMEFVALIKVEIDRRNLLLH